MTLPTAVSFAGYRWVSTRDNPADKNRTPLAWQLEISADGSAWQVCDVGEQAWSAEEEAASWPSGGEGFPRTVSSVRGSVPVESGTGLVTLSDAFLKKPADDARATVGELAARYFRFRVLDVESTTASQYAYGWQLAEIGLMKSGQRVNWPTGVSIGLTGGTLNANNNSKLENLVNNVIWEEGKGEVNQTRESAFVQEYPSFVTIDAGETMSFDAYSLVGLKSYWYRMPSAWTFEISNDGEKWTRVDAKGGYMLTQEQRNLGDGYPEMGPFALRYPLLDRGAGNSIGDASPVSIAEGATLCLATDYEKFGALSGAGTLDLEFNAVGEINATAATFSGKVTGGGTLVVSGEGTQTFDDADLSGVTALELNGGAVVGTASFGGNDLAIAFNGGTLGAELSNIGRVSVSGPVKYAFPAIEPGVKSVSLQLISATEIPAEAQAAFAAGAVDVPRGWDYEISVTATGVHLNSWKRGLVLLLR